MRQEENRNKLRFRMKLNPRSRCTMWWHNIPKTQCSRVQLLRPFGTELLGNATVHNSALLVLISAENGANHWQVASWSGYKEMADSLSWYSVIWVEWSDCVDRGRQSTIIYCWGFMVLEGRKGLSWGNMSGCLTHSGSIKIVTTEMIEGNLSGLPHVPLFSGQRRSSCVW